MSDPSPTTVAQRVYAAFGAGDGAALLGLAHPDSTWTLHGPAAHPYAGTYRGQDELARWLGLIGSSVEILAFEPRSFHASGDQVFVVGRERARWRPAGGEYDVAWLHRFTVEGGRVRAFEEWLDTATALAARKG